MDYSYLRTINHSYWSYVHQPGVYAVGPHRLYPWAASESSSACRWANHQLLCPERLWVWTPGGVSWGWWRHVVPLGFPKFSPGGAAPGFPNNPKISKVKWRDLLKILVAIHTDLVNIMNIFFKHPQGLTINGWHKVFPPLVSSLLVILGFIRMSNGIFLGRIWATRWYQHSGKPETKENQQVWTFNSDDTAWQLFSGHDTVHSILEARNLRFLQSGVCAKEQQLWELWVWTWGSCEKYPAWWTFTFCHGKIHHV